jgi:nephrocystin-3
MGAALHHDELNQLESVWQSIGMNLDKNSQRVIDSERKGFKEVRVFVSSTFKDFFAEREVLVKYVFPRLREWCLKRKLILVEIDLRWYISLINKLYCHK